MLEIELPRDIATGPLKEAGYRSRALEGPVLEAELSGNIATRAIEVLIAGYRSRGLERTFRGI